MGDLQKSQKISLLIFVMVGVVSSSLVGIYACSNINKTLHKIINTVNYILLNVILVFILLLIIKIIIISINKIVKNNYINKLKTITYIKDSTLIIYLLILFIIMFALSSVMC